MSALSLKRRGCFMEVGNGKLGNELQYFYEEASRRAYAHGSNVTVTAKITVIPPAKDNIGGVKYAITISSPMRKSIQYEAQFDDGVIIATAPYDIGVMQESLFYPESDEQDAEDKKTVKSREI